MTTSGSPRSLADDLRSRSDDALTMLLRRRPDLAAPPPGDIGQLAGRSATTSSTALALDHLSRFALQVLEACVACDEPFATPDVQALFPDTPAAAVGGQVDDLAALALLWGRPGEWRPTVAVRESLGRFPAGLGPPLSQLGGGDVDALLTAVDQAPAEVTAVLDVLTWHHPAGRVQDADRTVTTASATTPIEWLLARGVLRAIDRATVVLPREVVLHLRHGRLHQEVLVMAPEAVTQHHDPAVVDRHAAGTAAEVVRLVGTLLERWSVEPPGVLRSGGVGVRELRAAATGLDVDEQHAALVVETAWAAGLLAASGQVEDEWLPTPQYDAWRTLDVAERWAQLADAWVRSAHVASLVGTEAGSDGRVRALTPDGERIAAPDVRRWVLTDLAHFDPGTAATVESLVARHEWQHPRRGGRLRDDLVRWSLAEAAALGVCARGAVSSFGRALFSGDGPDATVAALRALLPEPVDHVLLQADLTAVAPGPLDDDLSRTLSLLADVESSGGATVYRFSQRSIRRALDAGRSAAECHGFLQTVSRTPVPQPLTYLIDDVARRHGRLRVGTAASYLRCDDPAVLDELLAGRGADSLRLRRLAPTVVVSPSPPDVLIERLHELGLAPAAEGGDGAVVVRRPDERRTGVRRAPQHRAADPPTPSATVAGSIVRALRAAERGARRGPRTQGPALGSEVPRTAMAETLEVLRGATASGSSVWLGYVDNDGVAGERVVDPVAVSGGQLTAYDHRTESVRQFAVHRVTGVAPLPSEP